MKYYKVDFNISAPSQIMQDARDLVAAMAGEIGFETFEDTDNGIAGYVQTGELNREMLDMLINEFPMEDVKIEYTIKDAEYKDWNEQWEQEGFSPIIVDNMCCIHDGRHLPQHDYKMSIEIDAKLAFGTGTHETTRMIISVLLHTDIEDKAILDCGCGTGILGIAALKRGAKRVVGYDIDEWSVDNTRHNAVINKVDDNYLPLLGDVSVLGRFDKEFDIVMANINRNILKSDIKEFCNIMKDDAILILSGFYTEDVDMLEKEAIKYGLKRTISKSENNWACVVFGSKQKDFWRQQITLSDKLSLTK